MTEADKVQESGASSVRGYPHIKVTDAGAIEALLPSGATVQELLGMKTPEAAEAVFRSALEALGHKADEKAGMASAMFAETEPKDAIEALLMVQMTATHVAMVDMSSRLSGAKLPQVREGVERSMTRLGRLYVSQVEALKKYRSKAQQVVRVERVTVNEGGQAIVGDVRHTCSD